jgi:hypothetical protein
MALFDPWHNMSTQYEIAVDQLLWQKFQCELRERASVLESLIEPPGPLNIARCRRVVRVLHTVISSALAIPVPEVVRVTRVLEGLLESMRGDAPIPRAPLDAYLTWLQRLSSASTKEAAAALNDAPLVIAEFVGVALAAD